MVCGPQQAFCMRATHYPKGSLIDREDKASLEKKTTHLNIYLSSSLKNGKTLYKRLFIFKLISLLKGSKEEKKTLRICNLVRLMVT